MKKLFIIGCPRSGTTMLQQALNRHPQIVIPPETSFFIDVLGRGRRAQRGRLSRLMRELKIDLPPLRERITRNNAVELYEQIAECYTRTLRRTGVEYFGDKTPRHMLRLREILTLYPQAKILLVFRDGRDVALSLTKVRWSSDNLYVNFRIWLQYNRIQERITQAGSMPLLAVRYEDLVTDPATELRKVAGFLGLPYHSDMASGGSSGEGIPPGELAWKARALETITASRIGNWKRELSREQIERLERWGGESLMALGYDVSVERFHGLPPSHYASLWLHYVIWRFQYAWRSRFVWEGQLK